MKKTKSKIGRNEQCPCGSGFKYKKCCLKKHRDAKHEVLAGTVAKPKNIAALRPITPVDYRAIQAARDRLNMRYKECDSIVTGHNPHTYQNV